MSVRESSCDSLNDDGGRLGNVMMCMVKHELGQHTHTRRLEESGREQAHTCRYSRYRTTVGWIHRVSLTLDSTHTRDGWRSGGRGRGREERGTKRNGRCRGSCRGSGAAVAAAASGTKSKTEQRDRMN
jgi:hypothetical protein